MNLDRRRSNCLRLVIMAVLVASTHARAGEEEKTEEGDEKERPEFYLVIKETNCRGDASYAVVDEAEFEQRLDQAKARNRVQHRAYVHARQAWRRDADVRGESFPLAAPKPVRVIRLLRYRDRDLAEAAREKRQEKLDKDAEREQRREERRLTRLRGRAKERAEQTAALKEKAEKLFEAKVEELMGGQKEAETEDDEKGEGEARE